MDEGGHYLVIRMCNEEEEIVLANIYMQNNDEPNLFDKVFCEIDKLECPNIIVAGDYNIVLDSSVDRFQSIETHIKSQDMLNTCLEEFDMVGIWCARNPEAKEYSWFKYFLTLSFSRIDYFLVSNGLAPCMKNC